LEDLSTNRCSPPLLTAGQVLADRFRIVARLGEGAIGEVYEAADSELEEQVAIKVLRPEIARDPEVLHRFKREIQLARRVTHPSVCRTFDLFHHRWEGGAELAFITMELLRGETLEARLQRGGRMEPAEALPLVAQIAEGLQAAHQAGVVHRDFKSGNVMLAPGSDGLRAVVTDFGLAWSSSAAASVTRTGALIGSPAYMAPEQVRGEAVTPATDIYAFGIVLYEMVTGNLPFSADTAVGTAIKRLREPPTLPRVHTPDLDPLWEEVILRCLESAPADRFATPVEVARALAVRDAARVSSPGALRRQRRSRWTLAAGAAVVVAGLVLGGVAWRMRQAPRQPSTDPTASAPRPAVAVFGFENLSGDPDVDYVERSLVRLLPFELAAGERLRLIPDEQVSRARQDLALAGGAGLSPETLKRLRSRLGVDFVITGSYLAGRRGNRGAGRLRCNVAIQDARSGEIIRTLSQDGTEEELLDLVDNLGMGLRGHLGVTDLSQADRLAVQAARPANTRAALLYAEGLENFSRFKTLAAKDLLEQASAADPENALIRADLAAVWRALGWEKRAEEAAREAVRLSSGLGDEPRLRVAARHAETRWQWDRAADIYRQLWARFPDDLEYGLDLARAQIQKGDARLALAGTVERLRASPEPSRDDPRIDLTEADAALNVGELTQAIDAASRARRKAEAQSAPLVVARALHFQGIALRKIGRLPEARAAGEQASELFRKAGDLASVAEALNTVGTVLVGQGKLDAARQVFADVVAIGREIGSEKTRGLGLANFGMVLVEQGDLEGARQRYEEALAIFRHTGSQRRAAITSAYLARFYQKLGRRADARSLLEETVTILRELGDRSSEATMLDNLATLSIEEGKAQEAWDLASRAAALYREIGQATGVQQVQGTRGRVLALRGDLPAAQRELESAAANLDASGEKLAAARQRIDLALILVEADRAKAGEAMARTALAGLGAQPAPDDEVVVRCALAWAALAQGRKESAAAELKRAKGPLAAANRPPQLLAALVTARIHATTGQARQAAVELRTVLAEAEQSGLRPLALEARLALGELEADTGGRERLEAVEREASAAGYGSLARRARAALSLTPVF
jgi:tetratricopeptide (TPR) repeat protein/TolB-like protein